MNIMIWCIHIFLKILSKSWKLVWWNFMLPPDAVEILAQAAKNRCSVLRKHQGHDSLRMVISCNFWYLCVRMPPLFIEHILSVTKHAKRKCVFFGWGWLENPGEQHFLQRTPGGWFPWLRNLRWSMMKRFGSRKFAQTQLFIVFIYF